MREQELAKLQAKEKMLEALFEYAAACHVDNILAENTAEDDAMPEFTLPPEYHKRMKKLLAKQDRKEFLNNTRNKTIKLLPRVAVFLLVLLGSFTIVVTSVQALRVKALNVILNFQNQYTSIQTSDEISVQPNQTDQQIPPDWHGYVPNYIPFGFKVTKTEKRNQFQAIYYSNEKGQTIRFTQYLSSNTDFRLDTEGATVQNFSIHNCDALLADKQGLISIAWKEDFLFSIIGEADKAELIKMAESIKKN